MRVYVAIGACQLTSSGEFGDGCLEADPVSEPLAITKDVLSLRGEWELQRVGYAWRDFQVTGPDVGSYETGSLVLVSGTGFGDFVGKIVSIKYSDSVQDAKSTVTLSVRIIQ